MRFFTKLDQLIEFYRKENMGLVTHLQFPVPLEEEDAIDEAEEDTGRQGRRGWQGWGGASRTLWSGLTGAHRAQGPAGRGRVYTAMVDGEPGL